MDYPEIAKRVQESEEEAQRDPAGYRRRVMLWVALGYIVYIGFILLTLAMITLGIALLFGPLIVVGLFLIASGIVTLWKSVAAIMAQFELPDGVDVTRDQAPALFAVTDELQQLLKLKPLTKIVLSTDFNAAAAQYPRRGWFGGTRNILVIGMPLLDCMRPDHVKSVLAHEFGHFAREHGSFPGWVERQRNAWRRLYMHHVESGRKARLLTRFLNWYAPRLDIVSYKLMRDREFEADQTSAGYVDARAVADALVTTAIVGPHVAEIVLERWRTALRAGEFAAVDHIASMLHDVKARIASKDGDPFTEEEWNAKPDYTDTHPRLKARIATLGFALQSPAEVSSFIAPPTSEADSAAAHFFGADEPAIRQQLAQHYQDEQKPYFDEQMPGYHMTQVVLSKLQELELNSLPWYTRLEIFRKRIFLEPRWDGDEDFATQLLQNAGDKDEVIFCVAMFYMERENWKGASELFQRIGPHLHMECHETIYTAGCYALKMAGLEDAIPAFEQRTKALDLLEHYNKHLNPYNNPRLKAARIEPWRLSLLQQWVSDISNLKEAWLVEIDMDPNAGPYRYLLVKRKRSFLEVSADKLDRALIEKLQAACTAADINYIMMHDPKYFKQQIKAIKKIDGSLIYQAK